ncbi:MAG TPA: hypothetical protein VG737_11800 [Cyclobacteriaceae bacterium]|nr:hypothetical protein [Cyclobacteriaceae bacterium]
MSLQIRTISKFNVIVFIAFVLISLSLSLARNFGAQQAPEYSDPYAGGDSTLVVTTPEPN